MSTSTEKEITRLEIQRQIERALYSNEALTRDLEQLKKSVSQVTKSNKIEIEVGKVVVRYESHDDWLENAPASQSMFFREVRSYRYIAIDKLGRLCFTTADYYQAEKNNAYPVTIYSTEG